MRTGGRRREKAWGPGPLALELTAYPTDLWGDGSDFGCEGLMGALV